MLRLFLLFFFSGVMCSFAQSPFIIQDFFDPAGRFFSQEITQQHYKKIDLVTKHKKDGKKIGADLHSSTFEYNYQGNLTSFVSHALGDRYHDSIHFKWNWEFGKLVSVAYRDQPKWTLEKKQKTAEGYKVYHLACIYAQCTGFVANDTFSTERVKVYSNAAGDSIEDWLNSSGKAYKRRVTSFNNEGDIIEVRLAFLTTSFYQLKKWEYNEQGLLIAYTEEEKNKTPVKYTYEYNSGKLSYIRFYLDKELQAETSILWRDALVKAFITRSDKEKRIEITEVSYQP